MAKTLTGAIGVKPFKYALERIGWNAGTVVIDDDFEAFARLTGRSIVPRRAQQHANTAFGGRKRSRIVNKIIENLAEARVMPTNHQSRQVGRIWEALMRNCQFNPHGAIILDHVCHSHNCAEQPCQIHEVHVAARQLGI